MLAPANLPRQRLDAIFLDHGSLEVLAFVQDGEVGVDLDTGVAVLELHARLLAAALAVGAAEFGFAEIGEGVLGLLAVEGPGSGF